MNDFMSLKIVDVFRPVFRLLKINYPVMRNILHVKLMMDGRRVPTVFSSSKKQKGNQFLKSLLIYMLYSLILIPFVFGNEPMLQMSLIFGISMFLLMTSMIADFSAVLLDVRDKTILHTKPIDLRTINAAKLVHIIIYMTLLTGAFTLIPSIVMLYVKGVSFFLLFLVVLFLFVSFIIALTTLIYLFILRFFSGERLKDMINYVQIALSIGIIVGYQIVIRAFDFTDMNLGYHFSWWHSLLPPIWFAAPFELIFGNSNSTEVLVLTILCFVVPIISVILYYLLMPSFEQNLQKLMEKIGVRKRKKWGLIGFFEKIICLSQEERMYFRFANQMMSAEREFKLKVYPSLGLAIVFPFIFILNDLSLHTFEEIRRSNLFLQMYFVNMVIGMVVYMLPYSGTYKGAWIFKAASVENANKMNSATIKAFLIRLYLPVYFIVAIAFCYIFSTRIIVDLAIVFVSGILHAVCTHLLTGKGEFPFSKPFESIKQGGGTTVTMIILMILAGVSAGIHFIFLYVPFGVYMYLIILLISVLIVWNIVFHRNTVQ